MKYINFVKKLFEEGKKLNFSNMEVFITTGTGLSLRSFEQKLDKYAISDSTGLSFRGIYDDSMGYFYSEKIDEELIPIILSKAIDNSKIVSNDEKEIIYEGDKEYKEVNLYNVDFSNTTEKEKINFVFSLEKTAHSLNERIKTVQYCVYGDSEGMRIISNSNGLYLEEKSNIAYAYAYVVAAIEDDTRTGSGYGVSMDFNDLNINQIAKDSVEEAVSMLGAKPIETGKYDAIIKNEVSTDLLESFSSVFSSEQVQKGLSLLKDKIGEEILDSRISIIDNPFLENGFANRAFDDEGVATYKKSIVEDGILKGYLYNLKTAEKEGVKTTGNAYRSSIKSPVSIAPTNFYIENGTTKYDDMISSMEKGILITDVQGLHAGLNPVSGDFSLSAQGFLIENGKKIRPISQITIAGNYFKILKKCLAIGDDLKFNLPSGAGYYGSPSIKVTDISVSG